MEKIKFDEVINACNKFIETNGEDKDLVNIQENIIVRNYLSMDEKAICLVKTFLDADKDVSIPSVFVSLAMDIAFLFDCLLAYTNIDIENLHDEDKIYENYDSIYKSGLADYIMDYCEKDYNRLINMAERALSIEHVSQLMTNLENLDSTSIDNLTRSIVDLKKNGDKNMIHDLATIARFYDPGMNDLKEKISDETLDKIFSNK